MKNHFSPRELAGAVGLSESSIKRWADVGRIGTSRTAGGHRRIPLAEALRFVRELQAELVQPEILGLPGYIPRSGLPVEDAAGDRLFALLAEGREADTVDLLVSLHLAGEPLPALIDGPLRSALGRLGEQWLDTEAEGIFREHRATQICVRGLHRLKTVQPLPSPGAPVALGGAPPGDPYILPTLSAATVLHSVGFVSVDLGPNTPAPSLRAAICEARPALVWISLTSFIPTKRVRDFLTEVTEAARQIDATVFVGGQSADSTAIRGLSGVFQGRTLTELGAFGSAIVQKSLPKGVNP